LNSASSKNNDGFLGQLKQVPLTLKKKSNMKKHKGGKLMPIIKKTSTKVKKKLAPIF